MKRVGVKGVELVNDWVFRMSTSGGSVKSQDRHMKNISWQKLNGLKRVRQRVRDRTVGRLRPKKLRVQIQKKVRVLFQKKRGG